jgi:hypothetical protein
MLAPTTRLVFLHLPRTGGTTLHRQLLAAFPPEQVCPERFPDLYRWPEERLAPYRLFSGHFTTRAVDRIPGDKVRVTVLRDPVARILSTWQFWARHNEAWHATGTYAGPAAARNSPDLATFLATREPEVCDAVNNQMARYLAGQVTARREGGLWENGVRLTDEGVLARAEAQLRSFEFVGLTEELDGLYQRLVPACGLPPCPRLPRLNSRDDQGPILDAVREPELTPEALALLDDLTRLDRPLYALARQLAGPGAGAGPA